MSSKKIDHYRASGIANDVAEKAFEHLTKPLNDKINKLGRDAYNELEMTQPFEALLSRYLPTLPAPKE